MANYELTEALKEKLDKANSLEEMMQALNEEGIEMTMDQLVGICEGNTDGELGEDDLDAVAGGVSNITRKIIIYIAQIGRKHIKKHLGW